VGPGAAPFGAMNPGLAPVAVGHARASLDAARSALDTAVGSLAENGGETVMASADVVALLLRVVQAQRHFAEIAYPRSSSPPASLR
jgi:hypothetical protein